MVRFKSYIKRVVLVGMTLFCVSCQAISFRTSLYRIIYEEPVTFSREFWFDDSELKKAIDRIAFILFTPNRTAEDATVTVYDFSDILSIDWESLRPERTEEVSAPPEEPSDTDEDVTEEEGYILTGDEIVFFAILVLSFDLLAVLLALAKTKKKA